ncbi:defensin-like protein 182 [Eucalyptus grandis]|nr:defensin-like protein 182 [Eucalyptus grandis]
MIEMPKVEAYCSEGIGLCGKGNECEEKCQARHGPGSQGSCDYIIKPPLCTCYYDCPTPPPLPKLCNGGGGLCSYSCEDQCCSDRCATKFSQGRGYCDDSAGPWLCQCQYPC